MAKRWLPYHQDEKKSRILSEELRISPITAQVLINRRLTEAGPARNFLNPSLDNIEKPYLLKGMDKAVERIARALKEGETITVFGDYDVDGTTSTVLLLHFLIQLNANCNYYIPDRMSEGYGLNCSAVKKLAEAGTRLVITVDNGISSYEEVKLAASLGVDVIVTDHHQPPDALPEAYAVINPQQESCPYPFKDLAGVGIAFNLVLALRFFLRKKLFWNGSTEPNVKRYLDLVALGTIADIAPLTGINRIMSVFGLEELSKGRRPGIKALKDVSATGKGIINVGHVGFQLAPRLNAAGRLSRADSGVKLLMTEDVNEAHNLASLLDEENKKRQSLEKSIFESAVQMVENAGINKKPAIVLASEEWHQGVIGIVASRLVEKYYRPTILISLSGGIGKGSARSIEAFHLYDGLACCSEYLESYGGHKYAAGLSIKKETIKAFTDAFEKSVGSAISPDDFIPPIKIDSSLRFDHIDDSLIEELQRLAPFGVANPEPIFISENVEVLSSTLLKGSHLKMRLGQGGKVLEAIGFNMPHIEVKEGYNISLAYSPTFNVWNGNRSIQLKIRDIKE